MISISIITIFSSSESLTQRQHKGLAVTWKPKPEQDTEEGVTGTEPHLTFLRPKMQRKA